MVIKKQEDIKDCGLSVLQALYKFYFDRWIDINEFKMKVSFGDNGVNLLSLSNLAKDYNIELDPLQGDFTSFKKLIIKNPIITIIKNEGSLHYIVIYKIKNGYIYIADPLKGKYKIKLEMFEAMFLNIIVTTSPIKEKIKVKRIDNKITNIFEHTNITYVYILSLIISLIFSLLVGSLMKIIIDYFVKNNTTDRLILVLIVFGLSILLHIINKYIYNLMILKLEQKIYYKLWKQMANKLYTSDNDYLRKLTAQDYVRRFGLLGDIAGFQARYFFNTVYQIIVLLSSLSFMFYLNSILSFIALTTAFVIFISSLIFKDLKNKYYNDLLQEILQNNNKSVEFLLNIQQIKLQKEWLYHNWNGVQKTLLKRQLKLQNIVMIQSSFNHFLELMSPLLIVYFSMNYINNQQMSIGTLLLFLSMFNYLIDATSFFSGFISNYQQHITNTKMINYVFNFQDETKNGDGIKLDKVNSIEFVKFNVGYETDKILFKIDNSFFRKSFKLKGQNGIGKSTLLNVLANIKSYNGSLKINEIEISQYDKKDYRNKVYLNNKNEIFPNCKILSYVSDFNEIKKRKFLNNLIKYKLQPIINHLQLDINNEIILNGENLSTGQKVVIKLLKLFSQEYKLILLDEAFDNIDKLLAKKIINKIKSFQKDAVIIEISHQNNYINKKAEVLEIEK